MQNSVVLSLQYVTKRVPGNTVVIIVTLLLNFRNISNFQYQIVIAIAIDMYVQRTPSPGVITDIKWVSGRLIVTNLAYMTPGF